MRMRRFCTGGIIGMVCLGFLCLLIAVGIARPLVPVVLPVTGITIRIERERLLELSKTDEAYVQCATDLDACESTSPIRALSLVADALLWFCAGGCVVLLLRRKVRDPLA